LSLPDDIRVDAGVRGGDRISPDYDPMIAKLIVHGTDRAAALGKMVAALRRAEVVGVATNLGLLRAILAHDDFAAGDFDTGFIARHPGLIEECGVPPDAAIAASALTVLASRAAANIVPSDPDSPWGDAGSWRMNLPGGQGVLLQSGETSISIRAQGDGVLVWDGRAHQVALSQGRVAIDGTSLPVTMVGLTALIDGAVFDFSEIDPLLPPASASAGGGRVTAPIPGRVTDIAVAVGDQVVRGQVLAVMEAMKMEISLTATRDGVVVSLHAAVGEMVAEGTELVVIGDGG
jgi:3-methylcrotonyl-CoA carboxylase alpha subunit